MGVKLVFKDVTYESLIDTEFVDAATRALPELDALHGEWEAARTEESR
jgi:hypothetical protein